MTLHSLKISRCICWQHPICKLASSGTQIRGTSQGVGKGEISKGYSLPPFFVKVLYDIYVLQYSYVLLFGVPCDSKRWFRLVGDSHNKLLFQQHDIEMAIDMISPFVHHFDLLWIPTWSQSETSGSPLGHGQLPTPSKDLPEEHPTDQGWRMTMVSSLIYRLLDGITHDLRTYKPRSWTTFCNVSFEAISIDVC